MENTWRMEIMNEMEEYERKLRRRGDGEIMTSKFRWDISQWGKIPRMAWDNFLKQESEILCPVDFSKCKIKRWAHNWSFETLVTAIVTICKFCVATCMTREVAALLWTLSRRRRAFLGPEILFYAFFPLIFGTWNTFICFLSSQFWDM